MNMFLDTNVLVKLYHEEAGTDKLTAFLNLYASDLILTLSDLTKIEFHSALWKRVRMKEIKPKTVRKILVALTTDWRMFNVVEVDRTVKEQAAELLDHYALQTNLRTLDAIQLSTAISAHPIVPIDYFVTSDGKLLTIAENFFPVFNPEAEVPG
jgi:predicted nucleic acid-binding protein